MIQKTVVRRNGFATVFYMHLRRSVVEYEVIESIGRKELHCSEITQID